MSRQLSHRLYRSLLRLAQKYDRLPESKLFIFREGVDIVHKSGSSLYYTSIMDKLLGSKSLFSPLPSSAASYVEVVRTSFRARSPSYVNADRYDAAFAFIRHFSEIWGLFSAIEGNSALIKGSKAIKSTLNPLQSKLSLPLPTAGPDGLVPGEISPGSSDEVDNPNGIRLASGISPGMFLVAHPMVQGSLRRLVVLILAHTPEFTYGVVVNKPTNYTFAESAQNLPDDALTPFLKCPVNFGGLVRRLNCLHSLPECDGEVVPHCRPGHQLYWNADLEKLTAVAKIRPEICDEVKFYAGCCSWNPGDLEEQVKMGYWITVHAPPDLVVQRPRHVNLVEAEGGMYSDGSDVDEDDDDDDDDDSSDDSDDSDDDSDSDSDSDDDSDDDDSDDDDETDDEDIEIALKDVSDDLVHGMVTALGRTGSADLSLKNMNTWSWMIYQINKLDRGIVRLPEWADSSNIPSSSFK